MIVFSLRTVNCVLPTTAPFLKRKCRIWHFGAALAPGCIVTRGSVVEQKLMPTYVRRYLNSVVSCCACGRERYTVPSIEQVPEPLRGLTSSDIRCLRLLDVHAGRYVHKQHGYRVRTSPFRISWSPLSVSQKISAIPDASRRQRLRRAYRFLLSSSQSSYVNFIRQRDRANQDPFDFRVFSDERFHGIECALWPHLYHQSDMCESVLEGRTSRLSGKESFFTKLRSPVIDYGLDYELLLYQYDRWLFKTVTGAINTARRQHCSPPIALHQKAFSAGFWQWQHRFLLDTVRQYGLPSLFVTISPYEWAFPFSSWITLLRPVTGRGPMQIPAFETMHIAHVLEQIVRGYLCGSNTNRW